METKDVVLLLAGFILGIIGGVIATRLDRTWTKLADIRSKRMRQEVFRNEQKRFDRLIRYKDSLASAHYATTESAFLVIESISGVIVILIGLFLLGITVALFDASRLFYIEIALCLALVFTGFVALASGYLGHRRLVGDLYRIQNFDKYQDYILDITTDLPPQAPSP